MKIQRQRDAFAYRYAFDPGHGVGVDPRLDVLDTRQPVTLSKPDEELLDHPAVQNFQDYLDAALEPRDPEEALAEYLSRVRPSQRIYYDVLQRYVGDKPSDSYPFPPSPVKQLAAPREPWATVTYPPGYEHEFDDPKPGNYYARRRR